MVERLLKVEHADEPTEIVIHVNMLKEGWDVTNLYTIVPLRAANARTLIEQSIGRGLRLPYGKRTGVAAVDRLNIVAHDKLPGDRRRGEQARLADPPADDRALGRGLRQATRTMVSVVAGQAQLSASEQIVSHGDRVRRSGKLRAFATPRSSRSRRSRIARLHRYERLPQSRGHAPGRTRSSARPRS